MLLRFAALFLTLLASLVSAGCRPREEVLSGQVFVATRAGQSVKLGAVQLSIFNESRLTQALEAKMRHLATTRPQLQHEYEAAAAAYERAARASASASKAHEDSYRTQEAGHPRFLAVDVSALAAAARAEAEARHALDALSAKLSYLDSVLFLVADLGPPDVVAQTDSDGRFSVRLPVAPRYGIVARAQREVLGQSEVYEWGVWVPFASRPASDLLLNNSNLFSLRSGPSLVTTASP